MRKTCTGALLLLVSTMAAAYAQAPAGTIAGIVTDSSGAALAGARVSVVNQDTGLARLLPTSSEGTYSVAALLPGLYKVVAEAEGFRRLERLASVEAGTTTEVNLSLVVGDMSATVTVSGAVPLLRHEDYQVGGVVRREQIDNLPLNGRNFLDLAKLEPGVSNPVRGTNNRIFVAALGSGLQTVPRVGHTRATVDGANINFVASIGATLQVSQDVVQEFQISTVNLDPSAGMSSNGAINIVTRSGGSEHHGSGFVLHRDHHLAAYPGLARDPTNLHPFFRRDQAGGFAGGPIRRERAFFFASYERNDQRGVVSVQPMGEFAGLGGIFPSPYVGNQFSARVDVRLPRNHTAFARYTDDRNRTFAPTNDRTDILPSGWAHRTNTVHQSLIGMTSVVSSTLVSDLRVSEFFVDSPEEPAGPENCPDPCVGRGTARIIIAGAGITLGKPRKLSFTGRRFQLSENITWQGRHHRVRVGFDWEHGKSTASSLDRDPAVLTLWDPAEVRQRNPAIPLPESFTTLDDILQLPLQSFLTAVGPPEDVQRNFRPYRVFDLYRVYGSDTWRVRSDLTINFGLAWSYEPNALNHDLTKPALLIPIVGTRGLEPPVAHADNFSPTLGFAWTVTNDGQTVVRGGAGRYFDPMNSTNQTALANERLALSPLGVGRLNLDGSNVPCGGRIADPRAPTSLTGADLLSCIGAIQAELSQGLDPNNRDFSIRNINRTKTGSGLHDASYETPYAIHASLGVQRQLARDFVISADVVWRHFVHTFIPGIDYNRWIPRQGTLPARAVIPPCVNDAQRLDDRAACSNGPITFDTTIGRQRYRGLLVRADKRLSHRTQILASYALGSYVGSNGTTAGAGFNNDDWFENYGPTATDLRHVLNVSGVVELPWRLRAAFSVSAQSAPPFSVYVGNADFNGDGTRNDLLPGTRVNQFGRGLDEEDLVRLVERYNAGRSAAERLQPPTNVSFNDSFFTQDLRVTRAFPLTRQKARIELFGEVFNLLNTANLVQYESNLASAANFGKPGARFNQVFGSGGPRAFQLGARVIF